MEIKSIKKNSEVIEFKVDGKKYEIWIWKRILGKVFEYMLSKESLEEAEAYCELLLERKLAERTVIENHYSSGVYLIYRNRAE